MNNKGHSKSVNSNSKTKFLLKGYHRKFLELLTGTPPHLTLNQVSYHSAESTEEIA